MREAVSRPGTLLSSELHTIIIVHKIVAVIAGGGIRQDHHKNGED